MRELLKKSKEFVSSLVLGQPKRVFCISMQRTGTTSIGKFFRDFGFSCAGWPADAKNSWSVSWYEGDFEKIFSSRDFCRSDAFEDSPWFLPGFYKILFHRFPGSKFILLTRDPDRWVKSMLRHSQGHVIGWTKVHCKIYRREKEYFELIRSGAIDEKHENRLTSPKTMTITGHEDQYKDIYRLHNTEVQDFFARNSPESLHVGRLEDPRKWVRIGEFLELDVPWDYDAHENRSKR